MDQTTPSNIVPFPGSRPETSQQPQVEQQQNQEDAADQGVEQVLDSFKSQEKSPPTTAETKQQFESMLGELGAIDLQNLKHPKELETVLRKYPGLFGEIEGLTDAKDKNAFSAALEKISNIEITGKAWLRKTLYKLVKYSPAFAGIGATLLSTSPVFGGAVAFYVLAKTQGEAEKFRLANLADEQFLDSKGQIEQMKSTIQTERNQRIGKLVEKFGRSEQLTEAELQEFRDKVQELINETNADLSQLGEQLGMAKEQRETFTRMAGNAGTTESQQESKTQQRTVQEQLEGFAKAA
jgi:hypothetical protein